MAFPRAALSSACRGIAGLIGAVAFVAVPGAAVAGAQTVVEEGDTVVMVAPAGGLSPSNDYANAIAMPLPQAAVVSPSRIVEATAPADPRTLFGEPGSAAGGAGTGVKTPVRVAPPAAPTGDAAEADGTAQPAESGTFHRPFTTNRVDPLGDVITDSIRSAPPAASSSAPTGLPTSAPAR